MTGDVAAISRCSMGMRRRTANQAPIPTRVTMLRARLARTNIFWVRSMRFFEAFATVELF